MRNGHARYRPRKVTALLTERCHLRCEFCRLWEDPATGVSAERWLETFRRNPGLRWINLSGGEIFAKERLGELLEGIVATQPSLLLLGFPTAGQRPEQVVEVVERLLATRLPRLAVTVSLDGGPPLHDRLRGVPGAFERAFGTWQRLRPLRGRRLVLRVGCTLTAAAGEQAATLEAELRRRVRDFRRDELHFNLAHHSSHYYRNDGYQAWPAEEALRVLERRRFGVDAVSWAEWVYGRLARRALREGFPPMGCEAIRETVFVTADLTVHPCSIWTRPLGNLRDHELSLEALLAGDAARAARTLVERRECPGCFTPCEAIPAMVRRPVRSTWLAWRASR